MSTTTKRSHQDGRKTTTPLNLNTESPEKPPKISRKTEMTEEELRTSILRGMYYLQGYARGKEGREKHEKKIATQRRLSWIRSFLKGLFHWPVL